MTPNRSAPRGRRPLHTLVAPFALSALAGAALAQTPPATPAAPAPPGYSIGDALKEAQPPRPAAPTRPPSPVVAEPASAPLALPSGETLTVQDFRLEGAEFIAEAELQAQLEPYKGRALTLAQIEEAAGRLTALYRSRGYLLARAWVPRQDARAGTLLIRIVTGRFGQFSLKNRSPVRDDLLARVFTPLQAEGAVSQAALERALLVVDDMPGAQLPRVAIAPGQAPGSSDFDIEIDAEPRFGGYLLGDNHGSRHTGRNRLSAGLDLQSPLGFADRLSLNLLGSENGGLANGRLAYAVPLAANGLRAELAGAKTTYELGGDWRELDATGTAHTLEATLSYPLLRSRERNLNVSLNLAAKHMRDEIGVVGLVTPKRAKVGTLALQHEAWSELFGRPLYAGWNAGLTVGRLRIDDAAQQALNRAGANTVGRYARLNFGASAGLELAPAWSASAAVSLQKALRGKNLDASEQMGISGASGVKAYREWVSGDNGYLVTAEVRRALPPLAGLAHSLSLFGDLGRVHLQDGAYAASNGTRLSGLGLGYHVRWRGLIARLQLARAVGPKPPEVAQDSRSRALLQLGLLF